MLIECELVRLTTACAYLVPELASMRVRNLLVPECSCYSSSEDEQRRTKVCGSWCIDRVAHPLPAEILGAQPSLSRSMLSAMRSESPVAS